MTEKPPTANETGGTDATGGEGIAIEAPDRSRPDEEIAVRVTGAPPGKRVEFEATMEDSGGVEWRSRATFVADADGVVDLTEQAPESGSYDGVHPMGWLWSMEAAAEDRLVTQLMDPDPTTVRLRASATAGAYDRTAERTITRAIGGITREEADHDEVVGTVFEPDGEGTHPGVVALHGSSGDPVDLYAALLASRGFAALSLQYAGDHEPLPDRVEEVPLSYFDRAASWFRARSGVEGEQVGIVGHSRGGEVGLLLGSRYDWVGAVVSYSGSGVLWDTPDGNPAWVEGGDPVPCVSGKGKPTLLEGQLDEADEETRRAATTAVAEVDGPILLISGGEDPIWPARRTSGMAADRLRESDFEYEFDHLTYDDAGHFVTPPYLPKSHQVFGGTPAGMARADVDAWPTAVEYLRRGLDGDDR